jgi:hypothetical protein
MLFLFTSLRFVSLMSIFILCSHITVFLRSGHTLLGVQQKCRFIVSLYIPSSLYVHDATIIIPHKPYEASQYAISIIPVLCSLYNVHKNTYWGGHHCITGFQLEKWTDFNYILYELNGYATGWTSPGSNPRRDKKFFSTSKHPDRLWVPRSLLFYGHLGHLPWE